jgi:putative tributyrin esterase
VEPDDVDGRALRGSSAAYCAIIAIVCALALLTACKKTELPPDHPRLTPAVSMQDVVFRSSSLNRNMHYRAVTPATIEAGRKFPVVYLLHGGGGNLRDWTNYSDVARFAERGLILVMPEGDESYYTNSADRPEDRYEDYIVHDLIQDVESRFPHCDPSHRAIIGVSMGGFGAVKISLRYPELFTFAAGISPALDVPSRPFSMKRISQWRHHRSIFGPWKGQTQRDNDPFVLARAVDPKRVAFLYLTCGNQEGLFAANRQFAQLLQEQHFRYDYQTGPGGHNWYQWDQRLEPLFQKLIAEVNRNH